MLALVQAKCFSYYTFASKNSLAATVRLKYQKLSCKIPLEQFFFANMYSVSFNSSASEYPEAFAYFFRKSTQLDFNCYKYCKFKNTDLLISSYGIYERVWHLSKFLGIVLGSIVGGLVLIAGVVVAVACYKRRK